jgi:diguanylate cyclase (GGDEF)-like protein/PAS domain S-box-containing protein
MARSYTAGPAAPRSLLRACVLAFAGGAVLITALMAIAIELSRGRMVGAMVSLTPGLVLIIGFLAQVGLLVWMLRVYMQQPLQRLTASIEQIAQGERVGVAEEPAESELRPLVSAVNQITYSLSRQAGALELTVAQRTQELSDTLSQREAILKSTQIGLVFVKERRVIWANDKFYAILGFPREVLEGQSCRLYYANEEDWQRVGQEAYPRMVQGQPYLTEVLYRCYDGGLIWCSVTGSALDATAYSKGTMWTIEDITERKQMEQQVTRLAHYDALTALPNRGMLRAQLEGACAEADANGTRLALLFMDLDHFKDVNDTLGHAIGDRLLRLVASRIVATVRGDNLVARLGGDEFVILLHPTTGADAARQAMELVSALNQPVVFDGYDLKVSVSIGISMFPEDGRDVEVLMRNADTAMYHAKAAGRNDYRFFTQEMNDRVAYRMRTESELRGALDRSELELYFQPQYELREGHLCAAEALLRWHHPQRGLILPNEFIKIAEDSGSIHEIGAWVLGSAIDALRRLKALGLPLFPIGVNISAVQFRKPELFLSIIEQELAAAQIAPQFLELEITETVLMQHAEETIQTLNRLSNLGVGLVLDDFGTGYSNLSYLKRFPVDRIKIDAGFVRDISIDKGDAAIVTAIIAMAHTLDIQVVAEGVEELAQLEFLRAHGCNSVQGYFLRRPVPLDELLELVRSGHLIEPAQQRFAAE